MTPADKQIVQATFAQLAPLADQAAAMFYARLFDMDPSLRPLFTTDLREQGKKLMQMIGVCVKGMMSLAAGSRSLSRDTASTNDPSFCHTRYLASFMACCSMASVGFARSSV